MTKSHVHILPLSQTNSPDCLLGCVITAPNLTIENKSYISKWDLIQFERGRYENFEKGSTKDIHEY